ncbi:M23 family metallopeptidase [Candidatus Obscuribacterales bacterium]|nr:M23 family metallopeptidase [Candidatus Obscuribacterales bacterium]MBX3152029.1 M23 family metallopeptidase [Candidatus Obscuribacterales bacterium]
MKKANRFPLFVKLSLAASMLLTCASSADAGDGSPPLKVKTDAKSVAHNKNEVPLAPERPIKTASKMPPVAPDVMTPAETQSHIAELRRKKLRLPLDGADIEKVKGNFYLGRVGHMHEAIDLVAPRNTPIHAVEDGTVERLFESKNGGLTIYQKDKSGKYVYYYAHLERYDDGIKQGDEIKAGQVIGYVGTSGNAPPNTPHLHFAISTLGPQDSVFRGTALDPYEVFKTR